MPKSSAEPFVESILHPSDFSPASEHAFAHALAIALHGPTRLVILNVGTGDKRRRWINFPSVRDTLERWGLIEDGKTRHTVSHDLPVRIKKVSLNKRQPLPAVLEYLVEHPTDLIVVATEGREGLLRWVRPSMAERLARKSRTLTLFVPDNSNGFVSLEDGRVTLRRILVPIGFRPEPQVAVSYAAHTATLSVAADEPVEITLLHAGGEGRGPNVTLPESNRCTWSNATMDGEKVNAIVEAANKQACDLIVMATAGHDGILDALRGSVTEQVLRRAPCPVLAIPAG
jgi:nucleotide-binding universal stress UspA family protein